jgi:hypothetical protein
MIDMKRSSRIFDRVEEDLVELSELYELCTFALELREQPVTEIQSDVLPVLASWCGVVAGARGVTAPDEHCIRRLTSFLAIHLDWLTDHPLAAEFADALDELTSAIRVALRPVDQYRSLSRNEK